MAVHILSPAIVCAVRPHGEHGAVVRCFTPSDGIQAGYVRGGRSRRLKPVLLPGNLIQTGYRARSEDQLAQLSVELIQSRAPLLSEPLAAAAIEWVCALTTSTLPEGQAYSNLYGALEGLLGAMEAAPAAYAWAGALARYEMLLLSDLGFGLDLSECAVTGTRTNLTHVSPKSGRAVSGEAARGYTNRLFPLPLFLSEGGPASWNDVFDGLRITGHFLERDLLVDRQRDILTARERLVERLRRVTR